MFIPTLIMAILSLLLLIIGYFRGGSEHIMGLKIALNISTRILPMLFFAFILAGMVQVLFPKEILSKWIGTESGLRGVIIGTVAGAFSPGGPYINLPIAAGLLHAGASAGTMVAFLTGWSLWAVARMPMEVGIMGWKFVIIRFLSTFLFPPVAGLIANLISKYLIKI